MSAPENKQPHVTDGTMTHSLSETMTFLHENLGVERSFDIIYRVIHVGDREACLYFIDGFCKDEIMNKVLFDLMQVTPDKMPENAHHMSKKMISYVEVDLKNQWNDIITGILSGVFALFIDGYDQCIMIDSRTYPARNVAEPDKDKAMRGSRDGFVETLVFNTALIRRRIRSTDLTMEIMRAGESSKTDIVVCYMKGRVNEKFLEQIRNRINSIKVDALTMGQESLAECLYRKKWYSPYPKFRYTERPDTAAAQVLEGHIVIIVDNSPNVMITPISVFDILEEADDFYFPPITGTYLRFARFLIAIMTFIITPLYLLLSQNINYVPEVFQFILLKEQTNIPLIWQFLILELALDGLRLAAVNTPSMLSTPLSIMAALVLGEFSVKSGWFNSEVMLYMAFVAIASFTQASYEFGYAIKFMRIITLILTAFFGIYGFIAGILVLIISIATNKTLEGSSYLYPLIPFNGKKLSYRLFRRRLPGSLD
ncbi:MAG: spore germination protein [Lachnospiraceae bacterium]|nr:spore germination protein [Lachnospiraceae bacterium]